MPGNELMRHADHFPLDNTPGEGGHGGPLRARWAARPFGLRYATAFSRSSVVDVDFSRITYDPVRQIALVGDDDGSLIPAMKHTSTHTSTSTGSQDRKGADSDSDATGR
jgi:putative ATP-grasp target RiPP